MLVNRKGRALAGQMPPAPDAGLYFWLHWSFVQQRVFSLCKQIPSWQCDIHPSLQRRKLPDEAPYA
jgi:hypothetical protein